ncbi:MAG: type II toxin-antitoxin system VapC family toxin [Anaerolineae bacterium]|nr:type II toxin-antitoxin system VapC family toxin [Anaerolineae bacterium]
MNIVVLDAWAIIALLEEEEPAATDVRHLLQERQTTIYLSAINLGEIYYTVARRRGIRAADKVRQLIDQLPLEVLTPDMPRIIAAARLKSQHRISYADAFALGTALGFDAILWTGDPELIALTGQVRIRALQRDA